jgi:hypothetical protein
VPRRVSIEIDNVLARTEADPAVDSRRTEFWESLKELEPRVVSRLARLAAERRWEIIFLTQHARSSRSTEQADAQRWLESKGFPLPCVYVTPGARGPIAAALHLDLVIDSRPESCLSVVTESDARTVLVWPGERGAIPADARRPEINVAKSFGECLDMLTAVQDPGPKTDGLFAWLKRAFGRKTANA